MNGEKNQYTSFILKDQIYAIPVKWVREIIRIPKITKVPLTPSYIKGVFNLRGEIFPIIDLKERLGIEGGITENSKTIIIKKDNNAFGIIVDRTSQVIDVEEKNIEKASASNEFIKNVIKINNEIYMILELDEFIKENEGFTKKVKTGTREQGIAKKEQSEGNRETYSQVVTFKMGKEIYGFLIKDVQEIIRYKEPNEIPNMPEYVKGVIHLRENILPIVDLRNMLNIPEIKPDEFTKVIVVKTDEAKVGFIVDRIREVLRISENKIKEPPHIIKIRERNEIKGIIKDEDETIMLLDPNILIPEEVATMLEEEKEEEKKEEEKEVISHERQYVVFKLGEEFYGIDIEKVREINRLSNITKVPRSPKFIEGVMNLRGEILPIVDLRKRFDLEKAPIDDLTRIIVTDVNKKKTGFIVDYVEGVEKIPETSISDLIGFGEISSSGQEFIDKVAKIDNRLVLLLKVEDIFSEKEEAQLEKVVSRANDKSKTSKKKEKPQNKKTKKLKRSK